MTDLASRDSLDVSVNQARDRLAEVETPEEAKDLYDKLETLSQYARRCRADTEKQNAIAETKLRTARKGGDLLAKTVRAHRPKEVSRDGTVLPEGMSRNMSSRWQALTKIPDDKWETTLADWKRDTDDLYLNYFVLLAKQYDRPLPRQPPEAAVALGQFPVIYCDPPWRYDFASTDARRAIENQYPTLSLDEIKALELPAAGDAVLFLWATSPKLGEAFQVLAAWGFEYRTCMVWVKDRIGMGYYARQQHELLLIARRGEFAPPPPDRRPSSVVTAPRGRHSEKPEQFYELIETMYPDLPRIELFARARRPGWEAWGNEAFA